MRVRHNTVPFHQKCICTITSHHHILFGGSLSLIENGRVKWRTAAWRTTSCVTWESKEESKIGMNMPFAHTHTPRPPRTAIAPADHGPRARGPGEGFHHEQKEGMQYLLTVDHH